MKRVLLSWSSGKDSAWSLRVLRKSEDYEIVGLLTTFNRAADRVAMHGVRRELVRAQADAAGLPLWEVDLPWPCANEDYESAMKAQCEKAVLAGVDCVAFGDLFLTDIRAYREKQLQGSGLEPIFPVWGIPTRELAGQLIDAGLRAKLTCVDTKQLDATFAGREFDAQLLSDLPAGADPCGENGEFHSFVYAGPMFRRNIPVELGQIVSREQFVFADLISQSVTEPVPAGEGSDR
ncbi:MAG TPA: ATP-binding protein [Terriglobales bacterium]